jgi:hypothetical protein
MTGSGDLPHREDHPEGHTHETVSTRVEHETGAPHVHEHKHDEAPAISHAHGSNGASEVRAPVAIPETVKVEDAPPPRVAVAETPVARPPVATAPVEQPPVVRTPVDVPPVAIAVVSSTPDDDKPARKGWWQRRFSGE